MKNRSTCKNILLIIPNVDFGGAQRSIFYLASSLSKKHKVHVCAFNTSTGKAMLKTDQLIDLKIPAGRSWLGKLYRFYQRWEAIKRIKTQLNIDTSISYLEGANYLNVLSRAHDRVIISVRGSKFYDETIYGLLGWFRLYVLVKIIYGYADQVVALNRGIKNELVKRLGLNTDKVIVIRNYFDYDHIMTMAFEPLSLSHEPLFKKKVLLYAGRLAKGKGLKEIVDVYSQLINKLPDLKLVFLGDGPSRNEIERYVDNFGLTYNSQSEKPEQEISANETQVWFLGFHSNPFKFLRRATVMMIASSSEGGPNILGEAMVCKTLVCAVNCPYGPAELILVGSSKNVPNNISFEGDHGVLLPVITAGNRPDIINEWTRTIHKYIVDESARSLVEERAFQWIKLQTEHRITSLWQKIL